MSIRSHPITHEDLEHERELTTDRLELIDGEIAVTPAPTTLHQRIAGRLYSLFEKVLPEQVYFAPVDVQLAEYTVVQPDIVVVLTELDSIVTLAGIEGAPSIVAEVISPSTSPRDMVVKRRLYAQHGVPEYWLVDPFTKHVTIFSNPVDGRYQAERTSEDQAISATIRGLSADLTMLFARVPGDTSQT